MTTALVWVACGASAPRVDSSTCQALPLPQPVRADIGVTHVAGRYVPRADQQASFLLAGASAVQALGASSLKLYLTPEYAAKYPETWPDGLRSLSDLAATPQFKAAFSMPFTTYVLTTYAFATGVGHPWRLQRDESLLSAEAQEIQQLAEYLLTTYAGTGKTFVLQNWEGDWALLGGYDPQQKATQAQAARMAEWINVRQTAVQAARSRVGEHGVSVRHALELNRVLDAAPGVVRVVTDVLPASCVDAVSYSAWEALEVDAKASPPEQSRQLQAQLSQAASAIRTHASGASLYLGELGFAENRLASEGVEMSGLLEAAVQASDAVGATHAFYWQIFDNECAGPDGVDCPGFWLVKPDNSLSAAGTLLKQLLQR